MERFAVSCLLCLAFLAGFASCRFSGEIQMEQTETEKDTPIVTTPVAVETESAESESHLVFRCNADGLHPDLLKSLAAVADAYYAIQEEPLVVNGGRRTLRRQAELMAAFSLKQLEGMYCRNGYPDYIRRIAELPEPFSADDVYRILASRTEGYISKHLTGQAADISPELKDAALARKLLKDAGLTVFDETSLGVRCLHVGLPGPPSEIIRE